LKRLASVSFGRTNLAAIAKGFGLRGATVTDTAQLEPLLNAFAAQDKAELWNIHISDKVVAPNTPRTMTRGHGTM
jgi:acetolactate synthase-1/2/3 large subunit